jgi:hypothetical protein
VVKALPAPQIRIYTGKGLELFTGIVRTGLFTRIATPFIAIDMLFICFKIGGGNFIMKISILFFSQ